MPQPTVFPQPPESSCQCKLGSVVVRLPAASRRKISTIRVFYYLTIINKCMCVKNCPTKRITFRPPTLEGPVIRNENRGDSRESIRRNTLIFITSERFARIALNLRFAIFSPPKRDSQKKGFRSGTLKRFDLSPQPQPPDSLVRISVCNQISDGNSY